MIWFDQVMLNDHICTSTFFVYIDDRHAFFKVAIRMNRGLVVVVCLFVRLTVIKTHRQGCRECINIDEWMCKLMQLLNPLCLSVYLFFILLISLSHLGIFQLNSTIGSSNLGILHTKWRRISSKVNWIQSDVPSKFLIYFQFVPPPPHLTPVYSSSLSNLLLNKVRQLSSDGIKVSLILRFDLIRSVLY